MADTSLLSFLDRLLPLFSVLDHFPEEDFSLPNQDPRLSPPVLRRRTCGDAPAITSAKPAAAVAQSSVKALLESMADAASHASASTHMLNKGHSDRIQRAREFFLKLCITPFSQASRPQPDSNTNMPS